MRKPVCRSSALSLVLLLVAGCGSTIQPRFGSGDTDRHPGYPPDETLGPRPSPVVPAAPDARPLTDQVCRSLSAPAGWIAIRYVAGGDNCPRSDPENPYNVMVIERLDGKPVGATMVVCADQPVPRHWVREWNREASVECPGARVRAGAPTAYWMRRVRGSEE